MSVLVLTQSVNQREFDAEATSLFREYSSKMLMYLFWINSGGTIAILSFMGSCVAARESNCLRWCLFFLVLGLISVGVTYAWLLIGIGKVKDANPNDRKKLIRKLDFAYYIGINCIPYTFWIITLFKMYRHWTFSTLIYKCIMFFTHSASAGTCICLI